MIVPKEVIELVQANLSMRSYNNYDDERLAELKEKMENAIKDYEECKQRIQERIDRDKPIKDWLETLKHNTTPTVTT